MKDHYSEHLELLEAWKDEVESLKEKHEKKDAKKKHGKKTQVRLRPDVIDQDASGLRITDRNTGIDYTVKDADEQEMLLSDPTGDVHRLPKSSAQRFKLG